MSEIQYEDLISNYGDPKLIFKGGQRVVFIVDHPIYGDIALKIGDYQTEANPKGWDINRIQREIEILKKIDSPYYPKNFNFELLPESSRYIIYEEFIESTPLSKCMDKFTNPIDILELIRSTTTGLNVLWVQKIVHRDLKPDNILINQNNEPVIIDLGITRNLEADSLTQTILGGPHTPEYAAPELLIYNKNDINHRTDQFSLGIIFIQLLLKGKHPFSPSLVGGTTIRENIVNDRWYSQIFNEDDLLPLRNLGHKCLGHRCCDRFRTPEMLMREINGCLEVL
ncbi:serine/threonine protein kinase [Methanolacinia petrolearia]|uniref:serine/threonine protein kinase n=1 Tax=Methanolacinia petrolearia TaxID=54120 RepID=UPI003BAD2F93